MARGVRRQPIFIDEDDCSTFMKIVDNVLEKYPFQICAFCLMTNHFHMLIQTGDTEIWHIMREILTNYARTFNQKYGYSGHLFDSRYVSKVVRDDRYLLEVSRYIHLNPVKAGIVELPEEYRYSSIRAYIGTADNKMLRMVNTELIMGIFKNGGPSDPGEQYRQFVYDVLSHGEMECQIQRDMKEDDDWLPY